MPHETDRTDTTHERKAALQELLYQHTRRLHKLELQQARRGDLTDPSVSTEIEDLHRTVANLEREIAAVQAAPPGKPPPPIRFFDPRFPVTLKEWQYHTRYLLNREFGNPPGYWCYVKPGIYLIGNWEPGDPFESVELDGFWMAKHPITVLQYQKFIEAGGYNNQDYWTPHGWQWRTGTNRTQPYWWGEERFKCDDQPVVDVSWYEATAFAAWLNRQLASVLPDGYCIRLPTEAEWEAAAAYDTEMQRHTYPWGNAPEPDASRADFGKDWQKSGPAPVGERPDSAAACGAQDMLGGVWEPATSSDRAYPVHSNSAVTDFRWSDEDVPYRGGTWWLNSIYERCSMRYDDDPAGNFINDGGVRVCLSPCMPAQMF